MKEKPEIGKRVTMPRKPKGYLSPRHPMANRTGTVVEHTMFNGYETGAVFVLWDATKKKEQEQSMELYKWLESELPT